MSLSTHTQSQEFVYAGASIAAAMLAGLFPKKHGNKNHLVKPDIKPALKSNKWRRHHHIGPPHHAR